MAAQPPSELTDAEIVVRVLAGDREQYAELVRRYQEGFFRHALGMVRSADAAADLAQDALIRAYVRLSSCTDHERFGAWAFRILRNGCLDYLKNRRRQTVPLDDVFVIAAAEDDPDFVAERGELRENILRALHALPEAQREAFLMKHVEDLSYEEMTELLDVSISALKMRVKRAREALQALLTAEREEHL